MCDNCATPKPKVDVQNELKQALECIREMIGEFGMTQIVNVIVGNKKDSNVKAYKHDELKNFGFGQDKDKIFWKSIVRLALVNGLLKKNIEKYGLLSLTQKGLEYIDQCFEIHMAVDVEFENISEEDFENAKLESVCDQVLFLALKDLRKKVAHEKSLPPYVIFQDPSLEDMAIKYPSDIQELSNINGVGKNKATKFGQPFVDFINKYVEENDIERPTDVILKGNAERSAKRVNIILNIDKKVDLPEIAAQLKIPFDDLLLEISQIVNTGTKINIRYFLDQFLDDDLQEEIIDYFKTQESENIDAAVNYFDNEFSFEELKLMHLQFVSDVAN